MFDVNDPVPVPLLVVSSLMSGEGLVLQHTPRDVIVAPPSEVIFPPEEAVCCDMLLTVSVDKTGSCFAPSFLQPREKIKKTLKIANWKTKKFDSFFMV